MRRPGRRAVVRLVQSREIHHLDLVVSDVDRTKSFYFTLFGGLAWGSREDTVVELYAAARAASWARAAAAVRVCTPSFS
jgi:predicted enzyme related to lactoylglutathione lyase